MSDNSNRFKDVINAARNQQTPQSQPSATPSAPPQPASQPQAKRGRPAGGKRTNPEYEQVAAYIPKALYKQVRIRLMQMEPEGQFSDLVEVLLTRWMQQGPQ